MPPMTPARVTPEGMKEMAQFHRNSCVCHAQCGADCIASITAAMLRAGADALESLTALTAQQEAEREEAAKEKKSLEVTPYVVRADRDRQLQRAEAAESALATQRQQVAALRDEFRKMSAQAVGAFIKARKRLDEVSAELCKTESNAYAHAADMIETALGLTSAPVPDPCDNPGT